MSKKCVFIIPYFGKFKNYFPLFLESCSHNENYDWLIFTDNTDPYTYPSNVKKYSTSFEAFKKTIQDRFDFEICLDVPYKLCDYKPAYGFVFEEIIKEYEYWGYCDCDLIFGSIDSVMAEAFSAGYEKMFSGGHCTIYKNTYENNRRFMKASSKSGELYRQAYTSNRIFAFDEMFYNENVHTLFIEDGAQVFETDLAFNVSTDAYMFRRKYYCSGCKGWKEEPQNRYIVFAQGHIYASPMLRSWKYGEEYLYAHFQGRKFETIEKQKTADGSLIFLPGKIFLQHGYPSLLTCIRWEIEWTTKERFVAFCKKIKRKLFSQRYFPIEHNPYVEENLGEIKK